MKKLLKSFVFSCMVVGLIPCIPRDLQGQSPEKQKVGQKTERDYANEAWMDGYKHLYKDEASLCREASSTSPAIPIFASCLRKD